MSKNILVTGAAGFLGFHLCKKLLENKIKVIGIDNINDYYDINLKKKRLEIIHKTAKNKNNWEFIKTDLINKDEMLEIFESYKPEKVVNLAAQAGVRYSLENPNAYINSNIVGFSNILESCKVSKVSHLLYASSSSVYGGNTKIPYSENDAVNHPVSIYAATKRSNELMAHAYSHLHNISATGMRFFTVYGPWGRPDMAPMIFSKAIIQKKPIKIFNKGDMSRSFSYVDDVVDIIIKLIEKPAESDKSFDTNMPNPSSSWSPHRIFNVGNEISLELEDFIYLLEEELNTKAIKEYQPMQLGDVKNTKADNKLLKNWIGDYSRTPHEQGIRNFVSWFKEYYDFKVT